MDVVRTYPRRQRVALGVRRVAPPRAGAVILLSVIVLLVLAAAAQAVVPGTLLFQKRIGSSTSEAGGWSMAAAPNGAMVLAGWKAVEPTGPLPMVAKYTSGGKPAWLGTFRTYADLGTGHVDAVACDSAGYVYLAATLLSADDDIAIIKYSPGGVALWARTYDGGSGGFDHAEDCAVDRAGNVIVVGQSNVTGRMGVVVLKYGPDGNPAWVTPTRWDPPAADPDAGDYDVDQIVLDGAGNVYIAGASHYKGLENAVVFKAAGADGAKLAGSVYEPRHGTESYFEGLAVRGSVVVGVGSVWSAADGSENALAVRYSLGLTEKYWKEWGVGNKTQEWFSDAVIDGKGNVFVTGDQWNEVVGGFDKAVTLKLNATLSKVVWSRLYLPKTRDAEGWYIARDSLGNIYVSGVKDVQAGHTQVAIWDYLTIKYSPAGAQKWLKTWSGGGPDSDEPDSILVSSKGGVYVGGDASARGDFAQAVLLKYKQ